MRPALGGDRGEHVVARRAAVRAGVAEHDHGRARVQLVLDQRQELGPHPAVVGVAGDVGDAGVARDGLARGAEVALALEHLGHLADPLDEHERAQLAERVVQRVQDADRKNVLALVTLVETSQRTKISGRRGRRGRYLRSIGTPPVCSEARIVRRTSTWAWRLRPFSSWPWVASRRLSCATTRWTWARSWIGPLGSARSSSVSGRFGGRLFGALDQVALELAAQVLLEAPQLIAGQPGTARVVLRELGLGLGAQAERAADPLHVDAEHARALAAAERGDREPREVAHRGLGAVTERLARSAGGACRG